MEKKKVSTRGVVCKRLSNIVIFAFDKCEFSETRICQMRVYVSCRVRFILGFGFGPIFMSSLFGCI